MVKPLTELTESQLHDVVLALQLALKSNWAQMESYRTSWEALLHRFEMEEYAKGEVRRERFARLLGRLSETQ